MSDHTTPPNIPYGYCHCGCGEKAPISPKSNAKRGVRKGEPLRFISGHNARKHFPDPEPRYCECGCGQLTPIAQAHNKRTGAIRGQRQRFIPGHNNRLRMGRNPEERFWEKVNRGAPDECWEWIGGKTVAGYGVFVVGSKKDGSWTRVLAHRFSFQIAGNTIPAHAEICHTCDNPACVNPNHLFAGTHQDNMSDMVSKRRHTIGTKNPQAKLTPSDVREIRQLRAEGLQHKEIAAKFGACRSAISLILEGKRWAHVK